MLRCGPSGILWTDVMSDLLLWIRWTLFCSSGSGWTAILASLTSPLIRIRDRLNLATDVVHHPS